MIATLLALVLLTVFGWALSSWVGPLRTDERLGVAFLTGAGAVTLILLLFSVAGLLWSLPLLAITSGIHAPHFQVLVGDIDELLLIKVVLHQEGQVLRHMLRLDTRLVAQEYLEVEGCRRTCDWKSERRNGACPAGRPLCNNE